MTDDRQAMFSQRYASGETPWDSGITPPEIMELLAELPPGRALDLGCGTGTTLRELLRHGWQADGVDFVDQALELARAKVGEFPGDACGLFQCDVTRLDDNPELRGEYDLIIDIGCGHCIGAEQMPSYARSIAARLAAGGVFMLYASHPRPESTVGWSPKQVERVFGAKLELRWEQRGDDIAIGAPSSWYRLGKRA